MDRQDLKRGALLANKIDAQERALIRLGKFIEHCSNVKRRYPKGADVGPMPYFSLNIGDADSRVEMPIDEVEAKEYMTYLETVQRKYKSEFEAI